MIRVTTGSRLHFGLIAAGAGGPRRFGGVGLMVDEPPLVVAAEHANEWSAEGPLADRALAFARRLPQPARARPLRLIVESAPPEHVGLGSGTQLGLAVARAAATAWGIDMPVAELARHVGRGHRSGLGVHGFEQGGFLVDGGKRGDDELAPLLLRAVFPEPWRIVLARPAGSVGLHGAAEQRVFAEMENTEHGDRLCRLVLLGMLPALAERDLTQFGEALHEYNRRAGEGFATAQGGHYAGAAVTELVEWFRSQGVRGVGQSSWGPTLFAIAADPEEADQLQGRLLRKANIEVVVTAARNEGAVCQIV